MAMVMSKKSKVAMCAVFLIMVLGITLAVLYSYGYFDENLKHHPSMAEKYSQSKSQPQTVHVVSIVYIAFFVIILTIFILQYTVELKKLINFVVVLFW